MTSSLSAKGEKEKLGVLGVLGVLESEPKGCVQTPKQEQKSEKSVTCINFFIRFSYRKLEFQEERERERDVLLILESSISICVSEFPLPGSPAPGHTGP